MSIEQQLEIIEMLSPVTGRDRAERFAIKIEQIIDKKIEDKKDTLATKVELLNVRNELSKEIGNAKIQVILAIASAAIFEPALAQMYRHFFGN